MANGAPNPLPPYLNIKHGMDFVPDLHDEYEAAKLAGTTGWDQAWKSYNDLGGTVAPPVLMALEGEAGPSPSCSLQG